MSESTPDRAWLFYIDDMVDFCEQVGRFTHGIGQQQCVADRMRFDATVRNLELIGEAATHVPDHIRRSSPAIPRRMIIATRNKLIHGYLAIDHDTLWSIIETDIPALWSGLRQLKLDKSHGGS
jgi:uncharacterized protein with HEPN domain